MISTEQAILIPRTRDRIPRDKWMRAECCRQIVVRIEKSWHIGHTTCAWTLPVYVTLDKAISTFFADQKCVVIANDKSVRIKVLLLSDVNRACHQSIHLADRKQKNFQCYSNICALDKIVTLTNLAFYVGLAFTISFSLMWIDDYNNNDNDAVINATMLMHMLFTMAHKKPGDFEERR